MPCIPIAFYPAIVYNGESNATPAVFGGAIFFLKGDFRPSAAKSMNDLADIGILILLLVLSAFFSSAETALTAVNEIRIKALADEGDKRAATVLQVLEQRPKMLSAILIGNNIVNLSASAMTATLAMRLWGDAFVAVATAVLTILLLIFGEITPKTFATVRAEKISLRFAGLVRLLMTLLTPVIFIVNAISGFLLRIMGIDPTQKAQMTEQELRTLVEVSEKDGVIEDDELQMINNVVDLDDTCAREIMIPRVDMKTVPVDATYDDLIAAFRRHRYTRLPVYEDQIDNIVGILNMKDLLVTTPETFDLRKMMREPYFAYETKSISDLLDEMRRGSISIVIVLDEYGATSGLLTLEDVLEEIVGDIRDEYRGRDHEEIQELIPGRKYSVLGGAALDDVNEATGLHLESENYDSIGGYIIEHSEDNIPKVGEFVDEPDGVRLIVDTVRRNRIIRVIILLPELPDKEDK